MSNSFDADFKHEKWSSANVFMLATVGAAVGLGNLWRFPFVAGQNGGAAFVLIYIGFVLLLGIPVMMAELAMGRRGQGSPIASMRRLAQEAGASRWWMAIGWISILIPLVGMSYYSIVGGWSVDYVIKAAMNAFDGFSGQESQNTFNLVLASPWRLLFFHGLFIASAVFVVARGVGNGIEAVSKYMMPALFAILVILVLNSIFNADIVRGIDFLFNPHFDKITPTGRHVDLRRRRADNRGSAKSCVYYRTGRHRRGSSSRRCHFPGRICERPGPGRRGGADLCDSAGGVRQYAGRLHRRSAVFRGVVFCSVFIGRWHA